MENNKTGIVLDKPYTNGLLTKAIKDGYAQITFESDYTKKILSKAKNPQVGNKALQMLLLFEKVYVSQWFDNVVFDDLIKLDLVEFQKHKLDAQGFNLNFALSIRELIFAETKRQGFKISAQHFDTLLPDVNSIRLGKIAKIAMDPKLDKLFEDIWGHPPKNKTRDATTFADGVFQQHLDILNRYSDNDIQISSKIWESYHHVSRLIETSQITGAPIFTNLKTTPSQNKINIQKTLDNSAYVALKLLWDETLFIPKVTTIEDVLRLRGDKRISHFRNHIYEWAKLLRSGEIGTELEIRQQIQEANRAIKDIGTYEKIAMWATFLAVPAMAFDLLTQLPIGGLIITPIGVVSTTLAIHKKLKHKWLMFGQ